MREITPDLWFARQGGGRGRVLLSLPSGLQSDERVTTIHDTLSATPTSSGSYQVGAPAGRLGVGIVVASTYGGHAALWRVEEGAEDRLYSATIVAVEGWRSSRFAVPRVRRTRCR